MHFKKPISLRALFLKFLDTFHAERSTSQNKKFQTLADSADHQFLPIRKDKAVLYWSSTQRPPIGKKKNCPGCDCMPEQFMHPNFYCACLIQIICRIFAPSPTLRSTEWRALQLLRQQQRYFPFSAHDSTGSFHYIPHSFVS